MELSRIYRGCPPGGKPNLEKDWYVEYGDDRKQMKKGINKHKTLAEREKAAQALKDKIDKVLERRAKQKPEAGEMFLLDAYQWAYDKEKDEWGEAHLNVNKSRKMYFEMAVEALKLSRLRIGDMTKSHMREMLEWIKKKRNLSKFSYIAYKEKYNHIFNILKDWEYIDINPCDFKAGFRKPPPKPKIILDDHERVLVRKHIMERKPYFFNYLMVLAHTSIRPSEIFRLRIKDIDLEKGLIILEADKAKDKEDRIAIIPDVLLPYLRSMDLEKYPKHFYVFGPQYTPKERKKPVRGQTATNHWKSLVKDPVKGSVKGLDSDGLGINKNMYWLKDWGMRTKRIAGVPVEAVQEQAGHATISQSMIYIGKYLPEDVEKLKKNTPDF